MDFKKQLMADGRELKERISAYSKLPQTETTQEALELLKCRLDMINTYLRVRYNILAY